MHQALYCLQVDASPRLAQVGRDAAIPVSSFVLVIHGTDVLLQRRVSIRAGEDLALIIEGAARQTCDLEQKRQLMMMP